MNFDTSCDKNSLSSLFMNTIDFISSYLFLKCVPKNTPWEMTINDTFQKFYPINLIWENPQ